MNITEKINIEMSKLSTTQELITRADNKGSLLLIVIGALLAFSDVIFEIPKKILDNSDLHWAITAGILICFIGYVVLVLICIGFILSLFLARTKEQSDSDELIKSKNSLWFSGGIINNTYSNYFKSIEKSNEDEYLKQLSSQIFINSQILMKKFKTINLALKFVFYIVILFTILMIVSYFI